MSLRNSLSRNIANGLAYLFRLPPTESGHDDIARRYQRHSPQQRDPRQRNPPTPFPQQTQRKTYTPERAVMMYEALHDYRRTLRTLEDESSLVRIIDEILEEIGVEVARARQEEMLVFSPLHLSTEYGGPLEKLKKARTLPVRTKAKRVDEILEQIRHNTAFVVGVAYHPDTYLDEGQEFLVQEGMEYLHQHGL